MIAVDLLLPAGSQKKKQQQQFSPRTLRSWPDPGTITA